MSIRYDWVFRPIRTTDTSFEWTISNGASDSTGVALESSGRIWSGPTGRSIRLNETSGTDFYMQLGTASTLTIVSTDRSMRILGGVTEVFSVDAAQTHIAFTTSSTEVSTVNLTLGYGR